MVCNILRGEDVGLIDECPLTGTKVRREFHECIYEDFWNTQST